RAGRFSLVTSEPILAELAEVLSRAKFRERGITPAQVTEMLDLLRNGVELVAIQDLVQPCSDPKAHKIIETALVGGVDLLVSGDQHRHEAAVVEHLAKASIEVIRPAAFVRTLHGLLAAQLGGLFTDWPIEP